MLFGSKAEWNFLVPQFNKPLLKGFDLGKKSFIKQSFLNVDGEYFIVSRYCDILLKYQYPHLDKKYRDSPVHQCIVATLLIKQ